MTPAEEEEFLRKEREGAVTPAGDSLKHDARRRSAKRSNFTTRMCSGLVMWSVEKYFQLRNIYRSAWKLLDYGAKPVNRPY